MSEHVVSIVIPCFNEKKTIEEILKRIDKVSLRKEIIIIDDCSTDGTQELLKKNPINLIFPLYIMIITKVRALL